MMPEEMIRGHQTKIKTVAEQLTQRKLMLEAELAQVARQLSEAIGAMGAMESILASQEPPKA